MSSDDNEVVHHGSGEGEEDTSTESEDSENEHEVELQLQEHEGNNDEEDSDPEEAMTREATQSPVRRAEPTSHDHDQPAASHQVNSYCACVTA